MALPCGHRGPGLPHPERARRIKVGRCPICPDPANTLGVTQRLTRQATTCRACQLSAGRCGCCGYHWTVDQGQDCQVIAPERHDPPTRTGPREAL